MRMRNKRISFILIYVAVGIFMCSNIMWAEDTIRVPFFSQRPSDENELIRIVKERIISRDLKGAISILVRELGKDKETDIGLLLIGTDQTFQEILVGEKHPYWYRAYKKPCSEFHLQLVHAIGRQKNISALIAVAAYYFRDLDEMDDTPYFKAMEEAFKITDKILHDADEGTREKIINELIPEVIESFPRKLFYAPTILYKKQIVNLFSSLAKINPGHPLLIKACRKIIGLDERIEKKIRLSRKLRLSDKPRPQHTVIYKDSLPSVTPAGKIITQQSGRDIKTAFAALYGQDKYRLMQKEIKRFLNSWNSFINSFTLVVRLLRDTALRAEYIDSHEEFVNPAEVQIIRSAEEMGLIKENNGKVFIRLPIGIDIPLKIEKKEKVVRMIDGRYYHKKYSLDRDGIEEIFKNRFFFGLGIGHSKYNEINYQALILAMIKVGSGYEMMQVKKYRNNLIDSAIKLESIDTGLSEERIRQEYDSMAVVKKWLKKLGVLNIDIEESPFETDTECLRLEDRRDRDIQRDI